MGSPKSPHRSQSRKPTRNRPAKLHERKSRKRVVERTTKRGPEPAESSVEGAAAVSPASSSSSTHETDQSSLEDELGLADDLDLSLDDLAPPVESSGEASPSVGPAESASQPLEQDEPLPSLDDQLGLDQGLDLDLLHDDLEMDVVNRESACQRGEARSRCAAPAGISR